MNSEISLIIDIVVKDGLRDKQIEAFKKLAPLVLKEEGCLQYELKEVEDDKNRFIILEKWASNEALLAHDETAHMIEADSKSPLFREKTTVLKLFDI
ncbi:antibiotic biosynthesis monooxygenase [Arcobacter sp. KX21116]|jgi:quinol monooxygenase YgiN|uniref:putative quinol monooxygenase n=1 Tax=Arcobacter iocasae TaxID=2906515 RepID=UPI0035D428E4